MKTVLVADDSLFMRTVIKGILDKEFSVIEADSGRACLEQFSRAHPDLVLLDIVMPEGELEGLRVLKAIKARDPKARVVMITALGRQEVVVAECMKLGASGCVVKPFDEGQVRRIVEENLK